LPAVAQEVTPSEGAAPAPGQTRLRALARLLALPAAFYFVAFCALTWPAMRFFSTRFFHGGGDGWYNTWALWWFDRAVSVLHQSPLYTPLIRYPFGTSLAGSELFSAFLGILLQRLLRLNLLETHNALLVLSFVLSGLTAFWLCFGATRSLPASLVGGYLFTFCSYRFAHAEGHLPLLSTQWIPLFVHLFGAFLKAPRVRTAVGAAVALALCNVYYLLFCVGAGLLFVVWHAARRRDPLFLLRRQHRGPLSAFLLATLLTSGPALAVFLAQEKGDPLLGIPLSRDLSLDLLAPLIPGGHWRFAALTQGYWSRLPGNIHESSVHLGLSVLALMIYVAWRRRRIAEPDLGFWYLLFFASLVVALGPVLHVWGKERFALPQALLFEKVGLLRLFSAPVRLIVMSVLAASVLVAHGLTSLWREGRRGRMVAAAFTTVLCIEYLPRPLPLSSPEMPAFVAFLQSQPGPGAVADTVSPRWNLLYHQTAHARPILFGHVARLPRSVAEKEAGIREILLARDYLRLSSYGFRFLVLRRSEAGPAARLAYADEDVAVYDLTSPP
jgi:hypothetical protein